MSSPVIRAAGGVLWRPRPDGAVEVALVHRPRYDDWSLPKGKAEPDEHLLACALREVREETGFDALAGRHLGTSRYLAMAAGRPARKTVHWWAMQVIGGSFEASREVDQMVWLPPAQALRRIRTGRGAAALRRFLRGSARTQTLLLVRHARATPAGEWVGDEGSRPLDARGRTQAGALASLLAAYGPDCVTAAAPVRCVETVKPLATTLGLPIEIEPALSKDAHSSDPLRTRQRVHDLLQTRDSAVVCSEGAVICDLVRSLTPQRRVTAGRGSTWAVSFDQGQFVGSQYWAG